MAIEIKCKLVGKLQVQNGSSARGAWCKQEFVVETIETYPRKICMNVWGDDKVAELSGYNVGETLTVSVNIESREFNGRWYTDVRAWKIEPAGQAAPAYQDVPPVPADDPYMSGAGAYGSTLDDTDLPF